MISVIIPTFNEAAQLPATLHPLRKSRARHEVIMVDAQSEDETSSVAAKFGISVLQSEVRQRAFQMNLGAESAKGDVLLFLHADTRLPEGGLSSIVSGLANSSVVGGGFAREYDSPSLLLRMTCALAEVRTRWCGWFLGDQAMFVRRTVFVQLGGFPPWDIFEDLEFSRRLMRVGKVVTLRPPVISSGRRFQEKGAWRKTWDDLRLTSHYLRGKSPSVTKDPGENQVPFVTIPR